ncbi:hypothetical protein [Shewanella surugensis]|uniref:Uncharacterized protein n=1 Tax=Shewanella surugensis TaxID=212020 RepID=A0ABT0LFS0_9GAMM|nr:hypothetical protein [Shewanella surugensis]MCL1126205.1 hypothetical protein [Shewanella surugensis]
MGNIGSICSTSKNNYPEDKYHPHQPKSSQAMTANDSKPKFDIDFEGANDFEDFLEQSSRENIAQTFKRRYSPPKSPSISQEKQLEASEAFQYKTDYDVRNAIRSDILIKTHIQYSKIILEHINLCDQPVVFSQCSHITKTTHFAGIYTTTSSGQVSVYSQKEQILAPWFSQTLIEIMTATQDDYLNLSDKAIAMRVNTIIHQKVKQDPIADLNDPELDEKKQRQLKLELKSEKKQTRNEIGINSKQNNQPESIDTYLSNNYLGVACRESSLLAHFTLAYLGIESNIISASSSQSHHGRHVVVDVPSANMAIDPIQGILRKYSKSKYPTPSSLNTADDFNQTRTWKNTSFYNTYNTKIVIQQLCRPK